MIFGFVVGILWRSYFDYGATFFGFLLLLAFVFLVLSRLQNAPALLLATIFFTSLALGVGWYEVRDKTPPNLPLTGKALNPLPVKGGGAGVGSGAQGGVEAIVIDEPDVKDNYKRIIVEMDGEKVLVTMSHFPKVEYGDLVRLSGEIKRVKNFDESEFDWVSYLAKSEIYFGSVFPQVEVLGHDKAGWLRGRLFNFKNAFLSNLQELLPEPHVSFAGGLIVGAKESMGEDLLEEFRKVGLIHIVVLSGFNIMIVAIGVMHFLELFLHRYVSIVAGIIVIILFAMLVGGGATVVRATVMALLALLAKATGRTSDVARALIIAGLLMIIHNPKVLVFDLGFQLSFLATLGLIYISPIIKTKMSKMPMRGLAGDTIGAQLAVLPWILYKMGQLSIVALPVNLLVLPFVPFAMLFGFLAGALGFISSIIAIPFAWITYAMLFYMLAVVKIFASLPFAQVVSSSFPLIFVVMTYGLYVWWIWRFSPKESGTLSP